MMSGDILKHAEEAASASSVDDIRMHANKVFELVWGQSPEQQESLTTGAVHSHGWKTRWQVDNTQFDEAFYERNGTNPPQIQDIQSLGIMGRARAVRHYAQQVIDSESSSDMQREKATALIASLNNVIGWMKMDDGVTKGERQPRVDLTSEWDSPVEFWQSTADTGWLAEVYSQAINILKVDYEGDVDEAQMHAKGLLALSKKMMEGVDANSNGSVESIKMEGGMSAVMSEARNGGFLD